MSLPTGVYSMSNRRASTSEVKDLPRFPPERGTRFRFSESARHIPIGDLIETFLWIVCGHVIKRDGEIAELHRQIGRRWTFPFHFARLTPIIVLKEAENHVMNCIRGMDGGKKGGSHGQP
ncbi:MAG: hypothetical protein WA193_04510, partial [Candidatus Acidiferrales bacterium]